jgi:hypothetical protein
MFSSLQVGWPPVWGCFHAQARRRVVLPDSDIDGVLDDEPHALQEAAGRPWSVLFGVDQIWARAFDGWLWSDWHPLSVTGHA